ncbi:MAG: type II toxin-antitoxin system RelE/ParE family toxin [Caenispirillum sp.]|nr:type II toxin-antitoxin system RelE/ParE family toxin [Caenispirillum sp.]
MKDLVFVGSSLKALRSFPRRVRQDMGSALLLAQKGERSPSAKPFKISGVGGIVEIVEDHVGDTYRAVYTIRYATAVYVLHAFKKKSPRGIKTAQNDVDLIHQRLKEAQALHEQRSRRTSEPT